MSLTSLLQAADSGAGIYFSRQGVLLQWELADLIRELSAEPTDKPKPDADAAQVSAC